MRDRTKAQSVPGEKRISARERRQCSEYLSCGRRRCCALVLASRMRFLKMCTRSPKIQHAHIEPHAALAYWEPSGKLVIYTSTQTSVIDTSSAGGAFRSATIQSARHRAVCRRGIWREDASSLGTFDGGIGAQGASTGAVGVDAGRSIFDGSLPGRGGEDQDRGEEGRHDRRPPGRSASTTLAPTL